METYRSSAEATADKSELKRLAAALNAAKASLRLDGCRAWHLKGSCGDIATWGNGKSWLLFVQCRSARHWTATKARLSFCRVTQDGDEEGVLRLDHLPTKAEGAAIRKALGIRQSGPSPANAFQSSSANEGFRAVEPAEAPSPVPIPSAGSRGAETSIMPTPRPFASSRTIASDKPVTARTAIGPARLRWPAECPLS